VGLIIDTLIHGNPVAGYPSLMVTMLFLGGVQLITLGIIGEYLGRMFDESKGRPLYLLNQYKPAELWKNSQTDAQPGSAPVVYHEKDASRKTTKSSMTPDKR